MARSYYPRTALAILTGLNFFNYMDRSVLFAVQPLVQKEFPRSDAEYGFLTTAFFICYMVAAPIVGYFADRYSRKWIMVGGALLWCAATLLTAVTHNFETLLFRHALVGIGEATFVAVSPSFLSDLFSEEHRGRIFGVFYLNIGLGTAVGYIVGGKLGELYGWRAPFLVAAIPGFLLAVALAFLPEPVRGSHDLLKPTGERTTVLGLFRNGAFWMATLGMAMTSFALGGLQVWIPTFLSRSRGVPLGYANEVFGGITAFNAIAATLLGGWVGDRLLARTKSAYYLVSAATLAISVPAMLLAIYKTGPMMFPAIFVAEFFLFLNTAPLNAAVVNSVGAAIRATAIAVNLLAIHLLGDTFSAPLIGRISDRTNLETGFLAAIVAIAIGALILFYGMRFAPEIPNKIPAEVAAG
ncbi:MAG TPA: MFS transporter [Terriglobales bacterium]|nr:MFS transporter [Terriglobales bacterium]